MARNSANDKRHLHATIPCGGSAECHHLKGSSRTVLASCWWSCWRARAGSYPRHEHAFFFCVCVWFRLTVYEVGLPWVFSLVRIKLEEDSQSWASGRWVMVVIRSRSLRRELQGLVLWGINFVCRSHRVKLNMYQFHVYQLQTHDNDATLACCLPSILDRFDCRRKLIYSIFQKRS